jgi:hypothetical protein
MLPVTVLDGDDEGMARISEELRGALLVDRIVENVRRHVPEKAQLVPAQNRDLSAHRAVPLLEVAQTP